jgi:hypothetical protein
VHSCPLNLVDELGSLFLPLLALHAHEQHEEPPRLSSAPRANLSTAYSLPGEPGVFIRNAHGSPQAASDSCQILQISTHNHGCNQYPPITILLTTMVATNIHPLPYLQIKAYIHICVYQVLDRYWISVGYDRDNYFQQFNSIINYFFPNHHHIQLKDYNKISIQVHMYFNK